MKALALIFAALTLASVGGDAPAGPRDWPDALSGRLRAIKALHVVRLGYRESAIPFSYLGTDKKPVGYSLDLCHAIVATIAEDLGVATLGVEYVRVTPQDRLERVATGAVDLECGSTTNTAERRAQVAFSPPIFITGTRIAVPRGSAIRGVAGLAGKRIAVVGGTTTEAAIRTVDRLRRLGSTFVIAADYPDALALLASGRVDALAADEILLRGLLAETGRAREFRLVGEQISFESYGIAYPRNDAALSDAVERTLRTLAASREIVWIYDRWFVRPLPGGRSIGMPMSVELRRSFEFLGLPAD